MKTMAAICIGLTSAVAMKAQTQDSVAARWLAAADLPPPFEAPATLQAWQAKRLEVRSELWKLLGRLPPRPAVPAVEVLTREDRGDYVVEKFRFDNGAGALVPGYILLPKGAPGKSPAILYCHWHAGEYDLGKAELFESKHTPEAPGPAFARRGYVVLGVDASGFGERNGTGPDGPGQRDGRAEETAAKFNLWVGRTFWGMLIRDDLMALDYLASRPEVDPSRIGVTGMSMGATRTWWLMALDERLRTGVAIACMTRYRNLAMHGSIHEHDIGYFVPGMLSHFDSEAVISLIAPRPVLFQTGDSDGGSPVDGIHAIEAAVRPAYRLYGQESAFQSIVYPGLGHVYTPEMWKRTLDWMDEHLKGTVSK
jgi:dienelactone hydrolase